MSPPRPPPAPRTASRPASRGRLIVLSGPSGAGKSSVASRLLEDARYGRARTATTRPPRGRERPGVAYDFLTEEEFSRAVREGALLEHAEVYGHRYGTPRANVEAVLESGRHCVLVVDVQGVRSLQALPLLEALYVFVDAPSPEELRRRLERRDENAPEDVERRLQVAEEERRETGRFDVILLNDDLDRATRRLAAEAGLPYEPTRDPAPH